MTWLIIISVLCWDELWLSPINILHPNDGRYNTLDQLVFSKQ